VPFVEKFRLPRWVGTENWRYFSEKSTNPDNFFTVRLFEDSSAILAQDVCLNRKFVADLRMLLFAKNASYELFDC
jgi:hypothetical protein